MTAKEFEDLIANLRSNFTDKIDYLRILLKAFEPIRSPENSHLNNFYIILPVLIINFIDKMLLVKDQMGKKN